MRRLSAVLITLLLAACGSDGDGGSGPDPVTVDGNWVLAVPTLNGGGLSCSATGMTMSLAMSGEAAFSGSHTTGTLTCTGNDPVPFTAGPILNGVLDGHSVSFDFDDASFHFTGTVNDAETSMTGTTTLNLSGSVINGTWTATRQNAVRAAEVREQAGLPLRALLDRR